MISIRHRVGATLILLILFLGTTNASEPRKCMECKQCVQPPQVGTSGMVVCIQGCHEVPCEKPKNPPKANNCDTDGKTQYHQSLIDINQFYYRQKTAIREWLSRQSRQSTVY